MKNILLIDDNQLVRTAVEHYLSACGYEVAVTGSYSDLEQAVFDHKPDAVLCGLHAGGFGRGILPCMLRRAGPGRDFALVLLSYEDEPLITEMREAGMIDGHFLKKFSLDGLCDVIDEAVSGLSS